MTVSNCSSYKGDAVTGSLTGRVKCICMSANTVCHSIALCTLHRRLFSRSNGMGMTRLRTRVSGVRVSFGFGTRANHPSYCLGNRLMRGRVHSLRISGRMDPITTVPFMERTLMTRRRGVNRSGNVIVSNHSVNAAIFPGTRLGVFIATDSRMETRHHFSRLGRGKVPTSFRTVLGGMRRHSCVSARHRASPLHGTSSTVALSGDRVAVPRRGR